MEISETTVMAVIGAVSAVATGYSIANVRDGKNGDS